MTTINLPIFPLPIFLLPQGVTQLRIFEARYLKMVAVAIKQNGFVIFPAEQESIVNTFQTGSWVEIINFDQGDDGLLMIDVRCKSLVDIDVAAMSQDKAKLHHADVTVKAHWPEIKLDNTTDKFADSLCKLFSDNSELSCLYPEKSLALGNWVVARWLELLPVELNEKRLFVDQGSFSQAKKFVQGIILPEE